MARSGREPLLALALIAAAAAGFLAGRAWGPGAPPEGTGAETPPAAGIPAAPSPGAAPPPGRSPTDGPPASSADAATALRAALGEEPTPAQAERARERAAWIRRTEEEKARGAGAAAARAEETAGRTLADEIRRERESLRALEEDRRRGGAMALLRGLRGNPVPLPDLVGDPGRFSALFGREAAGPTLDGRARTARDPLPDGSVLAFPAGRHRLDLRMREFPKDLLVRGAGMDATIVRLAGEIEAQSEVRSLAFQDLTLDCGDHYLTDLRTENPATVRMERCRVIGFDMGAGGSVMLDARAAALYASDCRFEAGYGRSPGSGNLFRIGGGFLARLERCVLVGPLSSVAPNMQGQTLVFSACRFVGFDDSFARTMGLPPAGVRFEDCTLEPRDAAASLRERLEFLTSFAAATRSDLFALLEDYHQDLFPVLEDPAYEEILFGSAAAGQVVDGTGRDAVPEGAPAATVVFPYGIHGWNASATFGKSGGSLVVQGAGMDATLVRLSGTVQGRRVTYRDLTVDVGSSDLARCVRRLPLLLRLERCRVLGFDCGAGGSVAVTSGPGAFQAVDSRFEAGYGRSPDGLANLFRATEPFAARLDGCVLRGVKGDLRPPGSRTRVLFSRCRLEEVPSSLRGEVDSLQKAGALRECSVEYAASPAEPRQERAPPRALSEINPDWGAGNAK